MGASSINPNRSGENLRPTFDKCTNMNGRVTSVSRAAYYHLKNIHRLKAFLTREALVTFVTPCYMAYLIITSIAFSQRRQNSAARIMTDTTKYDHMTPILQKLLRVPHRQPTYMIGLIHFNF